MHKYYSKYFKYIYLYVFKYKKYIECLLVDLKLYLLFAQAISYL